MMSNTCAASGNCAASHNSSAPHHGATSDNPSTTVNSATIIAASTILVIRIALRTAAIIPTSHDCSPSNHGPAAINGSSAVNCGASVNRPAAIAAASGPNFHKLAVVHRRCENAFGTRCGRTDRRNRKQYQGGHSSNEQLDCQIGHHDALLPCTGKLAGQSTAQPPGMFRPLQVTPILNACDYVDRMIAGSGQVGQDGGCKIQ